jgi:hypothetical protein
MAEDRQIPSVLCLFDAGIGKHAAGITRERRHDRGRPPTRSQLRVAVVDRDDLVTAQSVADCAQHDVGEPQAVEQPCLQADQHFHDHQFGQCPQVDLSWFGYSRFQCPPGLFVESGIVLLGHTPPLIVGAAVTDRPVCGARARRNGAGRRRRVRPNPRMTHELLDGHRNAPASIVLSVRFTQHRTARRRHAPAFGDRAVRRRHGRGGKTLAGGDVVHGHAHADQPGETSMADVRVVVVGGRGALLDSTHFPAEEPVSGGQKQDPGDRIPSGLLQQRLVQRSRQRRSGTVESGTDKHVRELDPLPGTADDTGQTCGGHRVTAPSSRGLGTASTAARSREESGCR